MILDHEGHLRKAAVFAPADWRSRRFDGDAPLPVVFVLPDGGNAYSSHGTAYACAGRTQMYPDSALMGGRYVRNLDALDPATGEVPYDDLFVAVFCEPVITRLVHTFEAREDPEDAPASGPVALDGTWSTYASYQALAWGPERATAWERTLSSGQRRQLLEGAGPMAHRYLEEA